MTDTPSRDLALVDQLRDMPAETPWLEFKAGNIDPDGIGKRCSALSNAARVEGRDCAYMVWGIEDGSHAVVGSSFQPDAQKVGGQLLQIWLANSLQPAAQRAVQLSGGRTFAGPFGVARNSGGDGSACGVQQHRLHPNWQRHAETD
jgi:hypothetical protein